MACKINKLRPTDKDIIKFRDDISILFYEAYRIYDSESERINNIVATDKKLLKQLDHCPLKNEILGFMNFKLKINREQLVKIMHNNSLQNFMMHPYSNVLTVPIMNLIFEHLMLFMSIHANIMDIYTLARMFRTFGRTPKEDPENIIVYAGELHANRYCEFLESINATPIITKLDHGKINITNYVTFSPEDKAKSFLF